MKKKKKKNFDIIWSNKKNKQNVYMVMIWWCVFVQHLANWQKKKTFQ